MLFHLHEISVKQNHSASKIQQDCNSRGALGVPKGSVTLCRVRSTETGSLEGCEVFFGPRIYSEIRVTIMTITPPFLRDSFSEYLHTCDRDGYRVVTAPYVTVDITKAESVTWLSETNQTRLEVRVWCG